MFPSVDQYWAKKRGEEIEPEPWQLAYRRAAQEIAQRRHEATLALAVDVPRQSNGAPHIATSSRPQGGRRAARSTTRSTRAGPDDDPSEPEPPPLERPYDRLLFALRNAYPDAYRVRADADGWACMARCPCCPDAGHTMYVVDRGDDLKPGIACRYHCDVRGIERMLGLDDPERAVRVAGFAEMLIDYRRWVAERRSS